MGSKRRRHYLTERDRFILEFLWKFKVATTAMLYHKFFEEVKPRTAYNTLQRLNRLAFISIRTDEYGKNHLWTLEKKGFEVVKHNLPELVAEYFKSDCKEHDLIVASLQLGEFLKEAPSDVEFVTDQELKSYHPEFIPSIIPNQEHYHRSDGYWIFKNGKNLELISLEVEITQKSRVRYGKYKFTYQRFPVNHRVLWVVKTSNHAARILQSMYKYEPEYKVHSFIYLKDFYKYGWKAKIFAGVDREQSILDLISINSQHIASTKRVECFQNYLLDRRLSYGIHTDKSSPTEIQ